MVEVSVDNAFSEDYAMQSDDVVFLDTDLQA